MPDSLEPPRGRSYYDLLQVSPTASQEVIQAAYRALARGYHPDLNPSDVAAQQMLQLNAAYVVLGDPVKRAQYDLRRQRSSRATVSAFRVEPARTVMRGKPRADAPIRIEDQRVARGEWTTMRTRRLSMPRVGLMFVMLLVLVLFVSAALWLTTELLDDGPTAFVPDVAQVAASVALHAERRSSLAIGQALNRFLTTPERPLTA